MRERALGVEIVGVLAVPLHLDGELIGGALGELQLIRQLRRARRLVHQLDADAVLLLLELTLQRVDLRLERLDEVASALPLRRRRLRLRLESRGVRLRARHARAEIALHRLLPLEGLLEARGEGRLGGFGVSERVAQASGFRLSLGGGSLRRGECRFHRRVPGRGRRAAVHNRGGLRGRAARDEGGAAEGRHGERAAEEQVAAGKRGGLRQVVIGGDRGRRLGDADGGRGRGGDGEGVSDVRVRVRAVARGYARWSRRGVGEHGGGWARARRSFPAKRSEGEHFSVSRRARWDATGRTRNAVAATAATAVSWTPTESTGSCSRGSAAARTRTHRRPRAGAPWAGSLFETEARLDILCRIQVVCLVRLASSALTACGRIARDIIASEVEGATRCVGGSRRRAMQCRDATRPYARRRGARRVGVFVHLADIFSETPRAQRERVPRSQR